MRLWRPLADELGRGYLGRLCSGALSSERHLAEHLGACMGAEDEQQSEPAFELLDVVLAELQMEYRTWVRDHSLVPVQYMVGAWSSAATPATDFGDGALFWRSLQTGRNARFCRDCVAIDLQSLGFSYWRRVHQLPGVDWCVHHHRPLSVSGGSAAFGKSPEVALAESTEVSAWRVDEALRSSVLNRYAQVLRWLLDESDAPADLASVTRAIRERASALDRKIGLSGDARSHLVILAQTLIPRDWPEAADLQRYVDHHRSFAEWIGISLDARPRPGKTESCALSMAILWPSAVEAVRTVFAASGHRSNAGEPTLDLSFEVMQALWLYHRGSNSRMAAALGQSPAAVSKAFRCAGMDTLIEDCFDRVEAAVAAVKEGMGIARSSARNGVEFQQTWAMLAALGLHAKVGSRRSVSKGEAIDVSAIVGSHEKSSLADAMAHHVD